MPMRADVKLTFDNQKIAGLLAKVGQATYDGVTQATELIRDEAKAIAPVDTGALRESITGEVERGISSVLANRATALNATTFGVTGTVAPHTDYAAYVEFGTGVRGEFSAGAGEGPYGSQRGMPAQPYMRPAFDHNKDRAIDLIKSAVAEALK